MSSSMARFSIFVATISMLLSFLVSLASVRHINSQQRLLDELVFQDTRGLYEDDPLLERLPRKFEAVAMNIQENHHFSLVDDTAWAETMPGHRGFVRLGPKGRSFGVSAYHQLHCINALRFDYTVARDGLVTDAAALSAKLGHDNHCFQFVRQAILCKADDTLVPINSKRNQSLSSAGFGVTHRCRNWAQVRDFVLQNDAKWVGIPFMGTKESL